MATKFEKVVKRILDDPEGFRRESDAAARKANPAITDDSCNRTRRGLCRSMGNGGRVR